MVGFSGTNASAVRAGHDGLQTMLQVLCISRGGALDFNVAELGAATESYREHDVCKSVFGIDFNFGLHLSLKVALLPEESNQALPILLNLTGVEWGLDGIVGYLHQARIGELLCARKLENAK